MYRQCCKLVPDNLVYRQALRGIERRKFNNDPGKVGMLVGAKNQPILLRAKSARSKRNFKQAIEHCEDAFVNNPWDVGAARVAAEAAEGLGLLVVAQWFVESVQAVTKDVDFLKFSAHIHEVNESWQKAIGCWEHVKKFHPNDQDANRQINALSAARRSSGPAWTTPSIDEPPPPRYPSPSNRTTPSSIGSSKSSSRRSSGWSRTS